MKRPLFLAPATITLLAAGAGTVQAQIKLPPLQFEEADKQGYFFRIGSRALFNVKASVSLSPQTPQEDGYYDNGFVLPDAGQSTSDTWNWGYQDVAQRNGDFIDYERYSNLPQAGVFSTRGDEPSIGAELIFGVELGRFAMGTREVSWGFEAGYGFNPFRAANSSVASGTVDYLAASHSLMGIEPPVPPYVGTPTGPGPLIALNPATSTAISSAASAAFDGELESSLHNFKVGAWLEMPVSPTVSLALSLGYSSIYADTQFSFRESIAIANAGIPAVPMTDTTIGARNWQPGFYGQFRATWQFSKYVGAFASADYQYNNKFHFSEAGREVNLDFKGAYAASLGFIFTW